MTPILSQAEVQCVVNGAALLLASLCLTKNVPIFAMTKVTMPATSL